MTDERGVTADIPGAGPARPGSPEYAAATLLAAFSDTRGSAAKRRAADALRDLQRHLVDPALDDAAADRIAAIAGELADELRSGPASRYSSPTPAHPHAASHPVAGHENPVAPPLRLHAEGDTAVALVTYGPQFEGPPGRLQGGVIAAAFDIVLAYGAMLAGKIGYTRSLTVRYRAGVPLGREVRYEARRVHDDDRHIAVSGRLVLPDGTVGAEADAEFALPRPLPRASP